MKDNEISIIKQENNFSFKKAELIKYNNEKKYKKCDYIFDIKNIFIILILVLLIMIIIQIIIIYDLKKIQNNYSQNNKNNISYVNEQNNNNNMRKYDINFNYEDYDTEIITDKIIRESGWIIGLNEARFINGIIRKNKLKNCLEIGVAHGGSSILILNSIKDIENSILVSLDLNKELYSNPNKLTGYRVNQYFPELKKNWKLYTGKQPHKFLVNLNIKFDFLFLDSTHVSPGEILNFIEALPFLKENAIVVIHDLLWHFMKVINSKFFPACISLIPALYGDKVFLQKNKRGISNIGAVFLYPNQKEHYLDYFLLLLNFWEYIPKDNQINDLRLFIKNYYKNKTYIDIFDEAVVQNKKVNKKIEKYVNKIEEKKYLVSLGTKWNITN